MVIGLDQGKAGKPINTHVRDTDGDGSLRAATLVRGVAADL